MRAAETLPPPHTMSNMITHTHTHGHPEVITGAAERVTTSFSPANLLVSPQTNQVLPTLSCGRRGRSMGKDMVVHQEGELSLWGPADHH